MEKDYNIQDAGYALYCKDIWTEPIEKPFDKFLGIDQVWINTSQIPFDCSKLNQELDFIENEYGEVLCYKHGKYTLHTDNMDEFLVHWFSKWKKSPYI